MKDLNLTQSYYEVGKNYTFEFYISGYPLPNVTWAFQKCSKYPKCKKSFDETEVFFFFTILELRCKKTIMYKHAFYLMFPGNQKRNNTSIRKHINISDNYENQRFWNYYLLCFKYFRKLYKTIYRIGDWYD